MRGADPAGRRPGYDSYGRRIPKDWKKTGGMIEYGYDDTVKFSPGHPENSARHRLARKITEDNPRWNKRTMGNRSYRPAGPRGPAR